VRTTIDLPDDLHALARQLAHEGHRSISEVIAELIRRGLPRSTPEVSVTSRGMPLTSVGRPVSADDVRSLDDEG